MMVRFTGLSSSNPIFMKGKANAQNMIGRRMRNGKYFFVKTLRRFVDDDIIGEDKGNQLFKINWLFVFSFE